MAPVVLFRSEHAAEGELGTCREYLPTVEFRSQVAPGSLVIGRYSVLPGYRELERELALNGSRLVNTSAQHDWIADVMAWAGPGGALEGLTPKTWTEWGHLAQDYPGRSFVVKGKTNSRKANWNTHMFAQSAADVPTVARRLLDDTFIREQGLVVREYIPLKTFGIGLNGIPITNEWRTFWLVIDDKQAWPLGSGFYWHAAHPEVTAYARFPVEAGVLAARAAELVARVGAMFVVIDVAETASGDWIVIEVNDGQMSGLCGVETNTLYANLHEAYRNVSDRTSGNELPRCTHVLKHGRSLCGFSITDWPAGHRWISFQDKEHLAQTTCPTCRVPVDMRFRRNNILDRTTSTNLPPDRHDARELHQFDAVCKAVFDE